MEFARLWLLFHFASGQAFFSGAAIILGAIGLSPWIRSRWPRSIRMGAVMLASALVGLSAVPAPWGVYFALAAVTVGWLIWEKRRQDAKDPWLVVVRNGTAVVWLIAVLLELPHQLSPAIGPIKADKLEVIGDSITAGAGETGVTRWPELLAAEHAVPVVDHAQMGATAAKAIKQADELGPGDSLVVVEIGGNDLLGSTTPVDFEQNLRKLLAKTCLPGRTVVMLELPLPPLYNRWGMIQRRVAREFHVPLIPRRVLGGVLLSKGNTSDSIHLTQEGHAAFAAAVWREVGSSLQSER